MVLIVSSWPCYSVFQFPSVYHEHKSHTVTCGCVKPWYQYVDTHTSTHPARSSLWVTAREGKASEQYREKRESLTSVLIAIIITTEPAKVKLNYDSTLIKIQTCYCASSPLLSVLSPLCSTTIQSPLSSPAASFTIFCLILFLICKNRDLHSCRHA